MKRWLSLALFALLAIACDREPTPSEDEHHDEDVGHEHEPRHDEVPRTVALSEEVVEAAGIVTTPAVRKAVSPMVRLPGEVGADPDREAAVAARIGGIIESVEVQPGDAVKRKDALATVRAPDLQSLRSAAAALRARAAAARANADRLDPLVDKRMASKQEAVAADAEADALEAEARGARDRLRALGVRSRGAVTFDVLAPIEGIVLDRPVVAGAPVTPETVVANIVADDEVWFLAHVFERDLARIEVGRTAIVELNAYPGHEFEGRIEYISHRVDPGATTLTARIPLSNPDSKLRLGLFGTANVVAVGDAPSEPVIAVPTSAITRMHGEPVVFVRHDDGHFEVHEVMLGRSDATHTEVVHGVREGERVVSTGAFTVKSALLRSTFAEGHH